MAERCKRSDIIVDYRGERIRKCQIDPRMNRYKEQGLSGEYQMSLAGTDVVIEATVDENRGRYSNHSWEPNAIYFLWKLTSSTVEVVFVQTE